jgi:nicotinamidase-related amidase
MNIHAEFLDRGDCTLLLVDLQKVMLDLCQKSDSVLKHAAALIEVAKIVDLPIICSVHNAGKLGSVAPELLKETAEPPILNKVEFSCFRNREIGAAVAETGRNTLILAGIETHVCVFQTGVHALRKGYRVHVVADAVSSRRSQNREIGLRRLERAGAVISSTEMVLFELLQRAATDEFRKALPVIKSLS